jgi:uncharacterized protein YabE (DUF348 family)
MEPTRSETRPHPPTISPERPLWRVFLPFLIIAVLLAVIGVIAFVLLVANLLQTTPVTVVLDGEAAQYDTRALTVADLVDDLGIALGAYDQIDPAPENRVEAGLVLHINRARAISLTVDGFTTALWTPLTNPAEILQSADIRVSDQDRILIDGTQVNATELSRWSLPVTRLSVRHALPLHINDMEGRQTIQTTGETVGDAMFEAGIPLFLADSVSIDLNTPITANLEVEIQRAFPVTITIDGATIETRTQGETIADALADAGVALMGLDHTVPHEDDLLQPDINVRVVRVKEEVMTETQPIPVETVYQADSTLELDHQFVVQEGQSGLQRTITRVRYEDGVEVSRTTDDVAIIRPLMNRVIAYGTNVVIRSIATPEGERSYWRVLRLYATSYHPEALGGDNITATGRTLVHGIVAAATEVLPFGTEIFVEGYGVGLVADTAPPRLGGMWIDLGYSDEDYQHWAGYVEVYVLTPVPAQINYFLP